MPLVNTSSCPLQATKGTRKTWFFELTGQKMDKSARQSICRKIETRTAQGFAGIGHALDLEISNLFER